MVWWLLFWANPQCVILDEPFANLDPSSQIRFKEIVKKQIENRTTTFLISSHDLNHVTEVCERIVLLEKGLPIKDLDNRFRHLCSVGVIF